MTKKLNKEALLVKKIRNKHKKLRYYNSNYDKVIIPEKPCILGEFLGVFSGDGSYFYDKKTGHHTIRIHLNANEDHKYALYLKNLIEEHFNKKVNMYYQSKTQLILSFYSKKIFDLIDSFLNIKEKTKNICLKNNIEEYSKEFLACFVRGVFDTDGSIQKYRIRVKTISEKLMKQVSHILSKFNINHKLVKVVDFRLNCRDCYEITIKKSEFKKFLSQISFSNPRKLKVLKDAMAGIRTPITTVAG